MSEYEDVAEFAYTHGDTLVRFAFMVTGGRAAEAEDLVQAVFLRFAQNGLDGIRDPVAYFRRAIVNEYTSASRRAGVALRARHLLVERWPSEPSTASDERISVLRALRRLTRREREAVVLRYYEDLDDQAIAELLGCSRSTVRSLIHRAIPKLRLDLDRGHNQPHRRPEDNE